MPMIYTSDERYLISEVTPYLFLSGHDAVHYRNLKRLGINCVVNCIRGLDHELPKIINYVKVSIDDDEDEDISEYFDVILPLIENVRTEGHGNKILVYCGMGISRSATICIAYFMKYHSMTLHDAYKKVQRRRTIICPNVGFFRQLIVLEAKLYNKTTVRMIEPTPGVWVADVVWAEIYEEVKDKLSVPTRRAFDINNISNISDIHHIDSVRSEL